MFWFLFRTLVFVSLDVLSVVFVSLAVLSFFVPLAVETVPPSLASRCPSIVVSSFGIHWRWWPREGGEQ